MSITLLSTQKKDLVMDASDRSPPLNPSETLESVHGVQYVVRSFSPRVPVEDLVTTHRKGEEHPVKSVVSNAFRASLIESFYAEFFSTLDRYRYGRIPSAALQYLCDQHGFKFKARFYADSGNLRNIDLEVN